ncbi:MAG TPA: hypothetical protein VIS74_03730 [Chthoniobacterales bacterium]
MRGIPLIRLAIVLALFLLAFVPLWQLTAAKPARAAATASAQPPAANETEPAQIEITPSRPASQFAIRYLGNVIWKGSGGKSAAALDLPRGAFDLQVEASWAPVDGAENALRVRISRDDLPLADASFWAADSIDEVMTVPAN